jgi:hypothetical protein
MKLSINKPFELDVELVDYKPNYLKISSNWVSVQTIEVDEAEMTKLLSYLNFSSDQFRLININKIDDFSFFWG